MRVDGMILRCKVNLVNLEPWNKKFKKRKKNTFIGKMAWQSTLKTAKQSPQKLPCSLPEATGFRGRTWALFLQIIIACLSLPVAYAEQMRR